MRTFRASPSGREAAAFHGCSASAMSMARHRGSRSSMARPRRFWRRRHQAVSCRDRNRDNPPLGCAAATGRSRGREVGWRCDEWPAVPHPAAISAAIGTRKAEFASTDIHRPGHRPRVRHLRPAEWGHGKTIDRGSVALRSVLTQCLAASGASGLPSAEVCCFAGRVCPETCSSWKVPDIAPQDLSAAASGLRRSSVRLRIETGQ